MGLKDFQRKLERKFVELVYGETGAELAEYALILALVVIVAIAVLSGLGGDIVKVFERVREALRIR